MVPSIGDTVVFHLRTKRKSVVGTPSEFGGKAWQPKRRALLRGVIRSFIIEETAFETLRFAKITYRHHDYMVPLQNIVPAERVADAAFNMRVPIPL